VNTLDDLELELRKLPGVHSAGFDQRDDVLLIQLHAGPERGDQPLPVAATRIAARHSDRPVAVEVVRWRAPEIREVPVALPAPGGGTVGGEHPAAPRPRLLAVLSSPDTDEGEVHLILEGRRTIGRAPGSRGLIGVADATIEALTGFGADFEPKARWARPLEANGDDDATVLIAVAVDDDGGLRYGLAAGATSIDATARATLDAVNRRLSYLLAIDL
jgi:hypothetical protein